MNDYKQIYKPAKRSRPWAEIVKDWLLAIAIALILFYIFVFNGVAK